MVELAFSINGKRFDLTPSMSSWRVRRSKDLAHGTPEVVICILEPRELGGLSLLKNQPS